MLTMKKIPNRSTRVLYFQIHWYNGFHEKAVTCTLILSFLSQLKNSRYVQRLKRYLFIFISLLSPPPPSPQVKAERKVVCKSIWYIKEWSFSLCCVLDITFPALWDQSSWGRGRENAVIDMRLHSGLSLNPDKLNRCWKKGTYWIYRAL